MRPAAPLIVYFDGGCRPNPGAMHAAVFSRGEAYYHDDLGHGDNSEAEWLALLFAVEWAAGQDPSDLILIGDSALVIAQAGGRQPCRSPRLQRHLDTFRAAAAGIARIRLRQVPRRRNLAGIALDRRWLP